MASSLVFVNCDNLRQLNEQLSRQLVASHIGKYHRNRSRQSQPTRLQHQQEESMTLSICDRSTDTASHVALTERLKQSFGSDEEGLNRNLMALNQQKIRQVLSAFKTLVPDKLGNIIGPKRTLLFVHHSYKSPAIPCDTCIFDKCSSKFLRAAKEEDQPIKHAWVSSPENRTNASPENTSKTDRRI